MTYQIVIKKIQIKRTLKMKKKEKEEKEEKTKER